MVTLMNKSLTILLLTLMAACQPFATSAQDAQTKDTPQVHYKGEIFYALDTPTTLPLAKLPMAAQPNSTPSLDSGQAMKSSKRNAQGELSGNILVKTRHPESLEQLMPQQSLPISDNFILLTFNQNVNLWDKLQQILALPTTENAELEISLKLNKPR